MKFHSINHFFVKTYKKVQRKNTMKICGLNKTTLLDYPGKVACTIFIGGCNFRCPFCQNGPLVLDSANQPEISQEEILKFLKKRQGILEGVCITGGEPTLYPELFSLIKKIRELGYMIKLDTNGSHPDVIKKLADEKLIDKVAMDIKASPDNYPTLCGLVSPDMNAIKASVSYLLEGNIDYEFRTTVVKELHTEQDFIEIAKWLKGAKAYYLQAYRDSEEVIKPGFSSFTFEELTYFKDMIKKYISLVEIRGIE